jgi:UDP-2,3-diacylglucosamine pyrophosphatase LpxH
MLDAVILSDLHINAHNCQAKALAAFLDRIRHEDVRTVRLILNGDVFDHFDKRVRRGNWEVLSDLRRLSDRLEVVWVKGNHDDTGPAETVAHLIGATFCPNHYTFFSNDDSMRFPTYYPTG